MITAQDIYKLSKKARPAIVGPFVDTLNKNANKYGLNTPERMAKYLANVMVETDGLQTFVEYHTGNANDYFKKYEPGTRPGKNLGNTQPGDGPKFRGRGAMQTTGRFNYAQAGKIIHGDENVYLNAPERLADPVEGTLASLIFWHKKNLNYHADNSPFSRVVRIINGGLNHFKEREQWLKILVDFLKKKINPTPNRTNPKNQPPPSPRSPLFNLLHRFLYPHP